MAADPNCLPNPQYQAFLDLMIENKMHVWPMTPISKMYYTERKAARDRVNYGEETPQEALDGLQERMLDELAKVQ